MKTILTVVIAVFVANFAMASGNLKVNFASNDADMAVVEISNSKVSHFEIELSDVYGEQIYRMETDVPRSKFKKRYDFTGLDNGDYLYSVQIDNEKVSKRLTVEDGNIYVKEIRKTLEPYFAQDEDMMKFTFLNFQSEDITLYVMDSYNRVLTEADLGEEFAITKGIDLSELSRGNYKVVLTNEREVFEHRFAVK